MLNLNCGTVHVYYTVCAIDRKIALPKHKRNYSIFESAYLQNVFQEFNKSNQLRLKISTFGRKVTIW